MPEIFNSPEAIEIIERCTMECRDRDRTISVTCLGELDVECYEEPYEEIICCKCFDAATDAELGIDRGRGNGR